MNTKGVEDGISDEQILPPLPKERYWFSDAEVLSHLETSEYQETQIRERLMRMTTGEKYSLYRAVIDTAKRKELIHLMPTAVPVEERTAEIEQLMETIEKALNASRIALDSNTLARRLLAISMIEKGWAAIAAIKRDHIEGKPK